MLERIWEALSNGGVDEAHVGSRLVRLLGIAAPGAADSAIRDAAPDSSANLISQAPAWIVPAAGEAHAQFAPGAGHDALLFGGDAGGGIAMIGGAFEASFSGAGSRIAGLADAASHYVVLYGENLDGGLVVDRTNNSLLSGGPGDWPELGRGADDVLVLSGDFSAGATLPSQPHGIDRVVLSRGDNYNLVSTDDQVAAGDTLTVDAMPLGTGNHVLFDGSAETDGRFVFYGSDSGDVFIGGAGNDRIVGLGGADMLTGGGGSDTFAYVRPGDSTGGNYDTLGDFNPASDKIDLPGTVAGFAAPVQSGSLSLANFDADLSAALGGLRASRAVWFAPDAGDLAGKIFLVVDANGVAGYQAGEDYVFAVAGSPLADLTGHTDIFV